MSIDTLISSVRALPEPTIKVLFDSIQEIRARDVSSPFRFAVAITGVGIYVDLGRLALECQVVRVLALLAFLAYTRLVVGAQHGLRVFTLFKGLLLNCRDRLEES